MSEQGSVSVVTFTEVFSVTLTNETRRRIHPLGAMNVSTEFHGNPFSNCRDILLWTEVLN